MGQYFYVLFAIACPLMMIFMMRGHGHGMHGHRHDHSGAATAPPSLEELQRQREELDRQIDERESLGEAAGDRSLDRV